MLSRGFLALRRRWKKNVLLLLLLLTIAFLLLSSLAARRALSKAVQELRETFPASIQLPVPKDELGSIRPTLEALAGVGGVFAAQNGLLHVENTRAIPGAYTAGGEEEMAKDLRFTALEDSRYEEDFLYGILRLQQGSHLAAQDSRKVLISEELAQLNGYAVGAIMEVTLPNGEPVRLEVAGIYRIEVPGPGSAAMPERDLPANHLFLPYNDVQEPELPADGVMLTLLLPDPTQVGQVQNEIMRLGGGRWQEKDLKINNSAYLASALPLERFSALLSLLAAALLSISVILLLLTLLLWTRGRKKEAGILLSLGIEVKTIVGQFWLETMMLTLPAFLLSFLLFQGLKEPLQNQFFALMQRALVLPVYPQDIALALGILLVSVTAAVYLACIPILTRKPRAVLASVS